MSYTVTLEGFVPGARFDGNPWTQARIEEAQAFGGPYTPLATFSLSPLDSDPTAPQARNFTTTSANPSGWYRVVWLDASSNEQDTPGVYSDQSQYETSGVPFRDLVARLQTMASVTPTEAKARINQAHREWVADTEAIKVNLEIGSTAAGQEVYPLESRVVSLRTLRVDGKRYDRQPLDAIADLNAGEAKVTGYGPSRFFAQEFTAGGGSEIALYPTPTQSGLAITGRASVLPQDMVADLDYPDLPPDFHEDLIRDALATTLERDDERFAEAQALKAQVEARKQKLVGRLTHRVGRGPARIKLAR